MDILRKEALKKLASQLCWYWDDDAYYGVPAIDRKRPYGNSDIDCDILEILKIEFPEGENEYSSSQKEWALELHKDLLNYLINLCKK